MLARNTCIDQLRQAGISREDAEALRRISMTLHRWHELECGDSNNYGSWAIERGKEAPRPHWHDANPWAGQCVYVPIARLAECVAGGNINCGGIVRPYDVAFLLEHWGQCGRDKLDAYILRQPNGMHSLGVRWGAAAEEYYSPHNSHSKMLEALATEYSSDGDPFMVHHHYLHGRGKDYTTRTRLPDRERGALKRLQAIVARYPGFAYYVQGDPRGASLYILRPGDVPDGADQLGSYYTRGIAVYK